ncbi:MAG: dienelactone hydrolase [Micrococcales bacterium]|nr:MAG: dienelactone hydrolase [Micrococcales bacterium]
MGVLDTWARGQHTAPVTGTAVTHPTYRKGEGPGVIVIHEMPGLTTGVVGFAEEVVAAGFTVVLPHLFGPREQPFSTGDVLRALPSVCVNREFTKIRRGVTSPVADWLRSLARELHADLGGPGVGALGMCFTGGYALAMMVDESTIAPVLCQPNVPFPIGRRRAGDVNLSPEDLAVVRRRAQGGCLALGLRFRNDSATGTRFESLTRELGEASIRVEFEGKGHSTVTEDRQQEGVDAVLDFFDRQLRPTHPQ